MLLADSLKRLGTETAFEVLAARRPAGARADIINLGIGQPDFKTPAAHRRGGHQGAARRPPRLHAGAGHPAAARGGRRRTWRSRHGVEVDPDTIVIMPGGKPTMFFSILMFGQPGAEIMYPDPGFPIYRSMIQYTGAKPVPIALNEENEFAFTADQVLAQITPKTSLIILNSPGNPTAAARCRKSEIAKLVAGLEKHPNVAVHVGRDLQPDALRRAQARELPALSRRSATG